MYGHIRFFEHFTKKYITDFFRFANYIELNGDAEGLLLERLNLKDEKALFELFDLDLLVITKGKKGARFLFRDGSDVQIIDKAPEKIVDSVDTSGAGDAFFSALLKEYAYSERIDSAFVDRAFSIANTASRNILMQFGSRKG